MSQYDDTIEAAAKKFNIDPALIRGIIATESSGNPNAKSGVGATGLMQIMPSNYKALGITDPTDPTQNIMGGAKLLSQLLDTSPDVTTALKRYQGGDDQSQWGPVNAAYPGKVFAAAGVGAPSQPAASKTLPGIPQVAQQPGGADAFSSLEVSGEAPNKAPALAAGNDPFSSLEVAGNAASPPAPPTQQTQAPQGSQPGMLASFGAGLGRGVQETALGAQQLLGHGMQALGGIGESPDLSSLITGQQPKNFIGRAGDWLVNDANQGLARGAQQVAPYSAAHPIATVAGNLGGSIAATAPLGLLAPAASTLGGMAAVGAGLGGATAALSPVDPNSQNFAADKAKQIGIGALTGGALSPAAGLLGRAISPNVSPDVQMLLDKGVTPTPGQIMGSGIARTEEKLTSVPALGDMIKNAQQRAVQQFNRATYNDALEPIGASIPSSVPTGSEAVNYVKNQIGNVYKSIEPRASLTVDQNFATDLNSIRNDLAQTAPGVLPQFDNIVQNQIVGKAAGGTMTNGLPIGGTMNGSQWGDTRSMISGLARKQITGNADADKWALSGALGDLTDALNQAVGRSSPPDVLQDLSKANAAWANYKQIEKAAGMAGASNNGNVFSPAQFMSAVRGGSTASQKATNAGLNADLGSAAQAVLGSKYPDSGTVGRGLMSLLTSGGLGAGLVTHPVGTISALGGIGLGSLPYTGLGQRAAAALLTARPQFAQPVGNAVTGLGRLIVPGSLPALLSGSR
jgi:hypothetical protein